MSIDLTKQTQPVAPATLHRELSPPVKAEKQIQELTASGKTRVNINPQIQKIMADDTKDVDMARVSEAQRAIAAGDYSIDSDKIAQSLVSALFTS